jgi:hypothetical protein
MTQYILFISDNTKSETTDDEWRVFFEKAQESGYFKGGSAIGDRITIGDQGVKVSSHIGGFMRFDSGDRNKLIDLLNVHPVVLHGGSVELCEMPME